MSRNKNKASKKASKIFKKCPRCQSPNVLIVEGDVLCTYCDWCSVDLDAPASSAPIRVSVPRNGDDEPAHPGSLAALVEKIIEENPFLTGDPVYA